MPPKWPATTHPDFFNRLPAPRAPGSRRVAETAETRGRGDSSRIYTTPASRPGTPPCAPRATRVPSASGSASGGGTSGSGMEEDPWAWPFPRSPSSGPVSRADLPGRLKRRRACRLTRPARPADPAAGTTATGWARPPPAVRAARPTQCASPSAPRPGRLAQCAHQCPTWPSRHIRRVSLRCRSQPWHGLAVAQGANGTCPRALAWRTAARRAPPDAPRSPGVTAASWASPPAGSVPADGAVDPAGPGRRCRAPSTGCSTRRAPLNPGGTPASWTALLAGSLPARWRHRACQDPPDGAIGGVARGVARPQAGEAAQAGKGEPGCAGGLNRDRKIASLKCPSPFP